MKPIVALTDFSPISLNAVNYAADLALAVNTNLALVHICQIPVIYSEVPLAAGDMTITIEEAERKMESLRNELLQRTVNKVGISTAVRTGMVIADTRDYCISVDPAIIVMGTRGSSGVERLFFGSNTVAAIKNFSWPLIIVPPEAKFVNIKKLGLACDLDKEVEPAAAGEIKELVKLFGAELHVLHVSKRPEKIPVARAEATKKLQKVFEEVRPSFHFLVNEDIDDALGEFADKNKLDLLIVLPEKHSFVGQLFHKSHTKKLVLHTHVPVMSVHD